MYRQSQRKFAIMMVGSIVFVFVIAAIIYVALRPLLASWATAPAFAFIALAGPIAGSAIAKQSRRHSKV